MIAAPLDAPTVALSLLEWGLPVPALASGLVVVVAVSLIARWTGTTAWTTVGRLLRPPGALGRALLPLLLAVTVVAMFASQYFVWPLQLILGVVLAALVWLFVRGGGEFENERENVRELNEALRPSTPTPGRELSVPGAIAFVGLVILLGVFLYEVPRWWTYGRESGIAQILALLMLFLAAALRLFGYVTNPFRGFTVAAFSLLAIRSLIWTGVLPGEQDLDSAGLTFQLTALVLLSAIALLFVLEALWLGDKTAPEPRKRQKFARAAGFWVAVGSAALLAIALGVAAFETTGGRGDRPEDEFGTLVPTEAPTIVDTPGDVDLDLAWTFAPVLHFHHDEEYPPIAVDAFLKGATESNAAPGGDAPPLSIDTLPTACPGNDEPPCGKISCPECQARKRETQPEGFAPQGEFYARVVRQDTSAGVFAGWDPDLETLIQYWIFYGYNRWQTETVFGRLVQEHQGDWEVVAVGLDTANKPLFVALSAHCGGQVVPWSEIEAAPGRASGNGIVVTSQREKPTDEVTHPVVAVAKGSHGNYAASDGHRPPDWGSCKELPSDALSALSYASNVRDLTDDSDTGWFAYPKSIKVVTRGAKPMSYPGRWGDGELITFGHRKPERTAGSPLSPPLQGNSWRRPFGLYFCHPHWYRAEGLPVDVDCGQSE
jgi:hypothetical protein